MSFTLPQFHEVDLTTFWEEAEADVVHWVSSDPDVLEIIDPDEPHARGVARAQGLVTIAVVAEYHLDGEVVEVPGSLHVDVVPSELAGVTIVPATPHALPPPPMAAWTGPVECVEPRGEEPAQPDDEDEDEDEEGDEDEWSDEDEWNYGGLLAERDVTLV